MTSPNTVEVTVKFVTIMQKYSHQKRIVMQLPSNPEKALDVIINRFNIPWQDNLERSVRIFIRGYPWETFLKKKMPLTHGDEIAFIPISGGG